MKLTKNYTSQTNNKKKSSKNSRLIYYKKRLKKKKLRKKILKVSSRIFFIILFVFIIIFSTRLIINKLNTKENKNLTSETENLYLDNDLSEFSSNDFSNFTVCLDPGHGGYDNGTKSSSNVYEKELTLKIALKVGSLLEKQNINVVYTRNSDKVPWPSSNIPDLRARAKISNDSKADAFISIHCNSNPNTSYKGIESWCRFPNTQGESLAKSIQNELVSSNYSDNRGLKYESNGSLAVLKFNTSPSALIEIGFLSNSYDSDFITSSNGQNVCAKNISVGILKYLSSQK